MLKDKNIDTIIILTTIIAVLLILLFINGERIGLMKVSANPAYVEKLFDESYVHKIDLVIDEDDWEDLLENPKDKTYYNATVIIDGEVFRNIGLRTKGKNSLHQINKYGSDRYSLKIEFDHFQKGKSYHGLDKISLNTSFQDNAFLKDYMTYDMMRFMEVAAPLTSFCYIRINDRDWGLFLVIEEMEEAFARRNYGIDYGKLYKPEYKRLDDINNDVALIYTDDNFISYDGIFRKARFKIDDSDKKRLIESLRKLSLKEDLDEIIDIPKLLRYFVVQTFVVNFDSYLGPTGHNYLLYEKDGQITMLPWDYNLAFGTYMLGRKNPINDSKLFINYPIDTPAPLEIMERRPLFFNIMSEYEYRIMYHSYYREFIEGYFKSDYFENKVDFLENLISPYIKKDPTKFCSYEDFKLAVETFKNFCLLRQTSVEGQINGEIPSTLRGQSEDSSKLIDGSTVYIPNMGNLKDMKKFKNSKLEEDSW